jgi:hypothetical protein
LGAIELLFTSAPAGTPGDVIAILNGTLRDIAVDPEAASALLALGVKDPRRVTPLW